MEQVRIQAKEYQSAHSKTESPNQGSCRSGEVMENWNIRESINGQWEVRDSQENR